MAIPYKNFSLPRQSKTKLCINKWYGLNYSSAIADKELAEMKNMSADGVCLCSRPARKTIASGIANPQNIFFCGNRLSYIDGGVLNVNYGNGFEKVDGTVGNVTAAVDFNNQKMLFYPTDVEYDYETGTISAQTSPLKKYEKSQDAFAVQSGSSFGLTCYCFGVADKENATCINLEPLKDDDGNVIKDADGLAKYPTVIINCLENPQFADDHGVKKYRRGLFVKAWQKTEDGEEKLLTKKQYCTEYYKEYEFGQPIVFENAYAAKLEVLIGYFYSTNNRDYGFVDKTCKSARDNDYASQSIKYWITPSEYPATNSRPIIKYACMDNNRVLGVEGNNFYGSSLGNYADWTDFVDAAGNPKETGAYAEEIYTYGDFTGIYKYKSNVVVTKKDCFYECYGNKPPYRIKLAAYVGCVDSRSMAEVGGALYWLGTDGVYRYAGGNPINISQKLTDGLGKISGGCAAGDGRRYYVYAKGEKQNCLLVYDTVTGLWCKEDDIGAVDMASFEGNVFALTEDGFIYKFRSGREDVLWGFETKEFDLNSSVKKIPKKLTVEVDGDENTAFDIYVRYDGGEYERVASYQTVGTEIAQIRLKNRVCDRFSFKICGKGTAKILGISCDIISSAKPHKKDGLITY